MPGRGQYWKKGGLVDETVKEEDLSQALQAKVNAGGGAGKMELLGETTLVGDNQIVTVNFTPVDIADCCYIEAVFVGVIKNSTAMGWQINGLNTNYTSRMVEFDGTSVNQGFGSTSSYLAGSLTTNTGVFSMIRINGLLQPNNHTLASGETSTDNATKNIYKFGGEQNSVITQFSSVTMDGLSEDWLSGAKLCVYCAKRV